MRAEIIPSDNTALLQPADVAEPLTSDQVMDADAILFTAGYEGSLPEVRAFAFYHRKRLGELVEEPAVDADLMTQELFETLSARLEEDNLISRLASQVQELKADVVALEEVDASASVVGSRVARVRPGYQTSRARFVSEDQLTLFAPETAAINAGPTPELIKKASRYHNYHENLFKYFAHVVRFTGRRQHKATKIALAAPAIAEAIIEIPILILIDSTYGTFVKYRFSNAMTDEYPHVGYDLHDGKLGGGWDKSLHSKFAKAVLGIVDVDEDEQNKDSDGGSPPNSSSLARELDSIAKSSKAPTRLMPLLEKSV
jgi:hypothetical protein